MMSEENNDSSEPEIDNSQYPEFPKVTPKEFHLSTELENERDDDSQYAELLNESVPRHFESNLEKSRRDDKKVQVVYYWGSRGQGKTTAMGQDAEWYYNRWLSTWWLWGSRSNENVFVAINQRCKEKWEQIIDKYTTKIQYSSTTEKNSPKGIHRLERLEKLQERLHCNCDRAYPINWLVPDYYTWSGVSEFNNNWKNKQEFDLAFENNLITRPFQELSRKEKNLLTSGKLAKPNHLVKTELIRICPFTIPNSPKNKEIFEKQFLKYAFEARDHHRWLILNPLTFETPNDKFNTIGHIMTRLKSWVDMFWQPQTPASVAKMRGVTESVPKKDWTLKEKNYDKICIIFSELRTIAPTNRYSPEIESNKSKRALVDLLPEMRHMRCWMLGDLQSPDDLNDSVRPMANYVVIKNSTAELLGKEWLTFLNTIETLRKERLLALSHGKFDDFKKVPYQYRNIIDFQLPRVQQLPKDKGYIVYPNGEFELETFKSGHYHHKQEQETIQSVTGITWKLNQEKILDSQTIEVDIDKSPKRLRSIEERQVMRWCAREYIITRNWKTVLANLQIKTRIADKLQRLPTTGIENLTPMSLSNKIRRDKELRKHLDFAKKNRSTPVEELILSLSDENGDKTDENN
jgi:hypothetical protein